MCVFSQSLHHEEEVTQGQFLNGGGIFWFLSFNGVLTFMGYIIPKRSLLKDSWDGNCVFHTFPKGICLKVNIIAQLEIELTYYDVAVQLVIHYAMGTPSNGVRQGV